VVGSVFYKKGVGGGGGLSKAAEAIHTVIQDLLVILQKQIPLNR